jgi:hypothetical protein
VSALSEVIANLRAAIAETQTARSEIRRVIDLVEQLVSQLRADTDGSANHLVEDGFSQLNMATEQLEEALALSAAGDETMERYINGVLLGAGSGNGSEAVGGGGGRPLAPPPAAPLPSGPDPVPKLVQDLAERLPPGGRGQTTVVFAYDGETSSDGTATRFESGRDRSAGAGLKPAYRGLIIMDHAEAKLAAAIRGARGAASSVVAVINNAPCPGQLGCDKIFADLIPAGTQVSIYVKSSETGTSLYGTYHGNGKAIL